MTQHELIVDLIREIDALRSVVRRYDDGWENQLFDRSGNVVRHTRWVRDGQTETIKAAEADAIREALAAKDRA